MRTGRLRPLLAVIALAACGRTEALRADHAWVRLPAVPGNPAAAYFTIHAGARDAALVAVSTPRALRADMHDAAMRRLASAPVAAGGDLPFQPGGRHVMLYDVDPKLRPGDAAPLTLAFADGARLTVQAKAQAAGDPPPP